MPAPRPNTVGEKPSSFHRQRRETDVDAVDEGNEVEQHHEGDDAQGDLAQHALFELGAHVGSSPGLSCF
jgi:hypothetical protein